MKKIEFAEVLHTFYSNTEKVQRKPYGRSRQATLRHDHGWKDCHDQEYFRSEAKRIAEAIS